VALCLSFEAEVDLDEVEILYFVVDFVDSLVVLAV
jgi:hypothetical protein